eukprot:14139.XXX_281710_281993_1 [CDS] Oithona nana genome sequencing.
MKILLLLCLLFYFVSENDGGSISRSQALQQMLDRDLQSADFIERHVRSAMKHSRERGRRRKPKSKESKESKERKS